MVRQWRLDKECYPSRVPPDLVLPATSTAVPVSPGTARVVDLTATWLAVKTSPHTRRAYRRDLGHWLSHCASLGVDPLNARMADVDAWIAVQRMRGARGTRPAAEATIARRVAALSSWYDYLVANTADDPRPLVARNPVARASRPRLDPDYSPTVGLTAAEIERLLATAEDGGAGEAALIRLVFTAGLRVGSAIAARVEHLGHHEGHRTLEISVKGHRRARIPLPPVVAQAVGAMLAERGHPTSGPLFVTPSGRPIYHMYVYRLVKRLAARAGLPAADRLTPHGLRHTAITLYLQETNGNVRGAQRYAGHARPETTMRYDRARRRLADHGAYVLAARFDPPPPDRAGDQVHDRTPDPTTGPPP
jgi:integrase/recombinase XerD